jgi:Restriction Enzyme Adenine Methylase Associated
MPELAVRLQKAIEWLDRYEPQGRAVGEANTKAGLIEPILEGLGWNIADPDEVHREYRRLPSDNPVDYALLVLRTPRLLVEAKGIGEHLNDPKWANQTIAYATAAGVEWVALTNGVEWHIYNAHAPVPLEQKLFQITRLRDGVAQAARVLQLLSKDNMTENRIEELWRAYFVDTQVHESLREMFSGGEPARELVSAVRRRTAVLTLKDIRASLTRVRATFEFPTVGDPTPSGAAGPAPASAGAARAAVRRSEGAVSEAERSLTLEDLLSRGLVAAGAVLEGSLRDGRAVTATLRSDGWIEFASAAYRTPSGAGAAAKESGADHSLSPSQKATDGWTFWKTPDGTGRLVTLKELRSRAADAL